MTPYRFSHIYHSFVVNLILFIVLWFVPRFILISTQSPILRPVYKYRCYIQYKTSSSFLVWPHCSGASCSCSLLGFSRRGRRSSRFNSTGILGLLLPPASIALRGWRWDGKMEEFKMGASSHRVKWWLRIEKVCFLQGRTRIWLARGGLRQRRVLTPESCTDLRSSGADGTLIMGYTVNTQIQTQTHNNTL
jgi:hypothetical protein